MRNSTANLNLDPEAFRPDQSVVLSGAPAPYGGDPEGGSIAKLGIAEGPVEPCEPVPALPSGCGPFGLPQAPGAGPATPRAATKPCAKPPSPPICARPPIAAEASDTQVEAPPGSRPVPLHEDQGGPAAGLAARKADGPAGSKANPRYFTANQRARRHARNALVPTLKEVWTAPDGTDARAGNPRPGQLLLGRRPEALGRGGLAAPLRLRPRRTPRAPRQLRAPR